VSWFSDVPQSVRSAFQRPTKFVSLPIPAARDYQGAVQDLGETPIMTAIKKYAPGITPLRVALMGFSEGCGGVSKLLASAGGGSVDSVIAIDGVHASYVNGKTLPMNPPKSWFEFAKKAILDERLFVDSYSSVKPPSYASTTETADWLWSNLNLSLNTEQISPPLPPLVAEPRTIHSNALPGQPSQAIEYPTIPWKLQRRAYGLILLGLKNNQPSGVADHQYQAAVMLPLCVKAFLADRWNTLDPKDASSTVST
jgi:hypothetical protein